MKIWKFDQWNSYPRAPGAERPTYWEVVAEYRLARVRTTWAAIAAIIGFAVAWDLGAKYYLVGGKEWVEP